MTDWNERYLLGDTPWEKGYASPPLREWIARTGVETWGRGPVLVPGCGTGHDVRALAELDLPVLGLDLAQQAIELASTYPTVGREEYELGDFLDPVWRQGKSFSAIWEHTCLCAIDPSLRRDYAAACADLIPSGGSLIGVFFLNPYDPGEEWQGPPFPSTMAELDELFSSGFIRETAWVPQSAYPGREGREWLALYRRR